MSDYIHAADGGKMTITTSRIDGSSIGRCDECGEIVWFKLELGELDLDADAERLAEMVATLPLDWQRGDAAVSPEPPNKEEVREALRGLVDAWKEYSEDTAVSPDPRHADWDVLNRFIEQHKKPAVEPPQPKPTSVRSS